MQNLIPNCSEFVERICLSEAEIQTLTKLLKIHCGVSTICRDDLDQEDLEAFEIWLKSPIGQTTFLSEEAKKLLEEYLKTMGRELI